MENERMVREREDCENEKWDICRVCAIEPINRTRYPVSHQPFDEKSTPLAVHRRRSRWTLVPGPQQNPDLDCNDRPHELKHYRRGVLPSAGCLHRRAARCQAGARRSITRAPP
jgi:hypothetical protein